MSEKEKLPWGLKQTAPGTMKAMSKDALTSFDQGTLSKKHLSKKELEELKKKQEDQAAAELLKDFEASFNEKKAMAKMFIKGTVINPSTKEEKSTTDKGNLYAPALKLMAKTSAANQSPSSSQLNTKSIKKEKDPSDLAAVAALAEQERMKKRNEEKEKEKRKSNLELFKEELKRMQLEREERNKKRQSTSREDTDETNKKTTEMDQNLDLDSSQDSNASGSNGKSSSNVDDLTTTNIFISNLSPKTIEQDLMRRFGKYGLLASVKIMWPRTDDEKARAANCGFVAFMNRKDAEIALKELDGCSENGQVMRLSWSKSINIPNQPVYIPPELIDIIIPPPPSGWPFNAQPQEASELRELKRKWKNKKKRRNSSYSRSRSRSDSSSSSSSRSRSSSSERNASVSDFNKNLQNGLVKVVIPTDRNLLCLIHRMIEFVIKEGPSFEALIMSKEINNPQFRFLFDNQSPAHGYYRWKLFSIINGDSTAKWRARPFKMFKTGSFWLPPRSFTVVGPDESYEKARQELEDKKGKLTNDKRDKFEEILKNLTTERKSISEAMIFSIENADKAQEIVEMLTKSIDATSDIPLNKTIARLYLLSDILHNCIVKVANASFYRKGFERVLPEIFLNLNKIYGAIVGKMKSESFKQKVLNCIRAWEDWTIYPNDFLVNLQNSFLGLVKTVDSNEKNSNEDVDGEPLEDEEDVDGEPLEDDEDAEENSEAEDADEKSSDKKKHKSAAEKSTTQNANTKFVNSKWETINPDKLKKQAITTSKWDFFEENLENKNLTMYDTDDDDEENDGKS